MNKVSVDSTKINLDRLLEVFDTLSKKTKPNPYIAVKSIKIIDKDRLYISVINHSNNGKNIMITIRNSLFSYWVVGEKEMSNQLSVTEINITNIYNLLIG